MDFARYWQPPDEEDLLFAHPDVAAALRSIAQARARVRPVRVHGTPRVYEIGGPADWAHLVDTYPFSGTGVAIPLVANSGATVLAKSWDPDATFWLRDGVITIDDEPTEWRRTSDGHRSPSRTRLTFGTLEALPSGP